MAVEVGKNPTPENGKIWNCEWKTCKNINKRVLSIRNAYADRIMSRSTFMLTVGWQQSLYQTRQMKGNPNRILCRFVDPTTLRPSSSKNVSERKFRLFCLFFHVAHGTLFQSHAHTHIQMQNMISISIALGAFESLTVFPFAKGKNVSIFVYFLKQKESIQCRK